MALGIIMWGLPAKFGQCSSSAAVSGIQAPSLLQIDVKSFCVCGHVMLTSDPSKVLM